MLFDRITVDSIIRIRLWEVSKGLLLQEYSTIQVTTFAISFPFSFLPFYWEIKWQCTAIFSFKVWRYEIAMTIQIFVALVLCSFFLFPTRTTITKAGLWNFSLFTRPLLLAETWVWSMINMYSRNMITLQDCTLSNKKRERLKT